MKAMIIYNHTSIDNSFGVGRTMIELRKLPLSINDILNIEKDIKNEKGYVNVMITDWKKIRA